MRALVVVVALGAPATADPAKLAALAPAAADARRALAVGPAGQAYEPDGQGAWIRRRAGGIAADVLGAVSGGRVAVKDGPPFALGAGGWTAVSLGRNARAVLGAGPRPLAAVGRVVFELRTPPVRLAEAPSPVLALAGSPGSVVVQLDTGVVRLDGGVWKPVTVVPAVVALVSDRWALVAGGAFDFIAGRPIVWPAGFHADAATTVGDDLYAADPAELVTVHAGKLAREPVPIDPPAPVVGLVADRAGRVVVAVRDGRLAVRDHGTWTVATVRDELPAARPGSPPAVSR